MIDLRALWLECIRYSWRNEDVFLSPIAEGLLFSLLSVKRRQHADRQRTSNTCTCLACRASHIHVLIVVVFLSDQSLFFAVKTAY